MATAEGKETKVQALGKAEILAKLTEYQNEMRLLGVSKIGLFGSFVHKQQNAQSDLDFLVEFDPARKNFKNFTALIGILEQLFDREVELVTTDSLSPYIGPHILAEVECVPLG